MLTTAVVFLIRILPPNVTCAFESPNASASTSINTCFYEGRDRRVCTITRDRMCHYLLLRDHLSHLSNFFRNLYAVGTSLKGHCELSTSSMAAVDLMPLGNF